MGAVRLGHAPGGQVAEPARHSVDHPLGVERQVGAHDPALITEQETMVGCRHSPRRHDRVSPGLNADLVVEAVVEEPRHIVHVALGDGTGVDGRRRRRTTGHGGHATSPGWEPRSRARWAEVRVGVAPSGGVVDPASIVESVERARRQACAW